MAYGLVLDPFCGASGGSHPAKVYRRGACWDPPIPSMRAGVAVERGMVHSRQLNVIISDNGIIYNF